MKANEKKFDYRIGAGFERCMCRNHCYWNDWNAEETDPLNSGTDINKDYRTGWWGELKYGC